MTLASQVYRLETLVPKLSYQSDRNFAGSLIANWRRDRRLTQTQQLWVDKLIAKAENPPPPPEPKVDATGITLSKLSALFDKARKNDIQVPRIRTLMTDGTKVGFKSKNGVIYIDVRDHYYGKIDDAGRLIRYNLIPYCQEVTDIAIAIGDNPSLFGKAHGQRLKWCMFCGTELRTTESLYYGYGPICAEKWGLAWDDARERIEEDKFTEAVSGFDFKAAAAKWKGMGQ